MSISSQIAEANKKIGRTFGGMFVLSRAGQNKHRRALYLCRCICGKEVIQTGAYLIRASYASCGCMTKANQAHAKIIHGMAHNPLYHCYRSAKRRCTSPKSAEWIRYGSRGIEFRLGSLQEFVQNMLPTWFKGATLDRINNDGHYEYSNIRWVTQSQQAHNRRDNLWLTYAGVTMIFSDWARKLNISKSSLRYRIKSWGLECALSTSNV